MSLTSPWLRALTIALAVLATAATMLLWNRVAGPRAIRVTGRIALLLTSYTLTMIAVLVSINIAYGGLISSWGDLFDNLRSGPPPAVNGGEMTPGRESTAPHSRPGHDRSQSSNEPRRTAHPR